MQNEKNKDDIISILFILDSSGSMQAMGDEPVQSMRFFYNTQKETGKEFLSTFITFNDNVKFVHKNLEGSKIDIKNTDFIPSGMTSLYDAIGTGIDYQKNIKTKNVICVILTDGHENSSNIYKSSDIIKLTREMETENKWVFIYLGANQDAFDISQSLGLNPKNSANYDYTPKGLNEMMRGVSDTVSRVVSHNVKVEDFVPEIMSSNLDNIPVLPPILSRTLSS